MNDLGRLNRREFFNWGTRGIGATAFASLLARDTSARAESLAQATFPNFAPRAKRAIHISLVGGMSHIDSYDYKPGLDKAHGKPLGSSEKPDIFFGQVGLLRRSDFQFKQRGQSGLWLSEMFPNIAEMADVITVIRSMTTDSANHTPALFFANSGFEFNGFPSVGSWVSYGLGCETESLPAFVVLSDGRGGPNGGASNWTSGFLPSQHQGVELRSGKTPVRDLFPAIEQPQGSAAAARDFLQKLNERHCDRSGADAMLSARMRSYELAARMQLSVPEVSDINSEPEHIRNMYGLSEGRTEDAGRRCLLARRLLERGVRFVQIYSGGPIGGSPRASWDAHENVQDNHSTEAGRIDKPIAGLLRDLKQRGMLDDTLVLFTTEFGRTPFAQSKANQVGPGRDHNKYGFSCWLAGGGVKAGFSFGQTDEIGWKTIENPVHWHDFHATVLHLMGVDHKKLTFYHNGIERRLTNVHGHIAKGIFA
ncbi:MAG: DUF1501 domain-containing protein [Verrucomicrobiota bacterium]|nr:DUF1501 domain-containing protein [Verrucomicrobiota bacterium]